MTTPDTACVPQPPWRRALKWAALLGIALYLGVIGYMVANEKALVFHPEQRQVAAPDAKFALNQHTVSYPSSDGVTLSAWIVPAAIRSKPTGMWMLICHGNLGNIGYRIDKATYYGAIAQLLREVTPKD